jgi:hypothetical protein
MTAIIILLIISLFIVVFYIAALLVFTPYEDDDKYLLKIMESGFRFHDRAMENNGVFRAVDETFAKFMILLTYNILKDRKFVDEKN